MNFFHECLQKYVETCSEKSYIEWENFPIARGEFHSFRE